MAIRVKGEGGMRVAMESRSLFMNKDFRYYRYCRYYHYCRHCGHYRYAICTHLGVEVLADKHELAHALLVFAPLVLERAAREHVHLGVTDGNGR